MSFERAYLSCRRCKELSAGKGSFDYRLHALSALEDERASLERVNGGDIGILGGKIAERHNAVRAGLKICLQCDFSWNGNSKTLSDIVAPFLEFKKTEPEKQEAISDFPGRQESDPEISSFGDYLRLENISCTDADGNVFEQYPVIYVRKDVYRDDKNEILSITPYNAVKNAAANGDFIPSFALSCNILAALYAQRKNPEIDAVLKQYLNKRNGNGYHGQNTIIDWGNQKIIHYPQDSDFKPHDGTDKINYGHKKTVLGFDRTDFSDTTLESALTIPNYRAHVQNLTGLRDPVILCQIGTYFDKPARVWVSSQNEMRASWLGCLNGLDLVSYYGLYNNGAVRGVRKI